MLLDGVRNLLGRHVPSAVALALRSSPVPMLVADTALAENDDPVWPSVCVCVCVCVCVSASPRRGGVRVSSSRR
jgi:hypothetical protein